MNLCQHTHSLPHPGGLLDQDHMFVVALDWVSEANNAREKLERDAAKHRSRHQGR